MKKKTGNVSLNMSFWVYVIKHKLVLGECYVCIKADMRSGDKREVLLILKNIA